MNEGQGMGVEEANRSSRLGRGLAALIGDVGQEMERPDGARGTRRLPIAFLKPNPGNPRRRFADEQIEDLARSIREKGIVQPIIVRPVAGAQNEFEIVAGERRWRAAQKAGLHEVPVLVYDLDDREALEIAIVENVQRADLNPIEEAQGYERLCRDFSYTQDELAKCIGKSRSHVANTLRLLKLPESVRELMRDGRLTAGHARALITHPDPAAMAQRIVDLDMNVREVEAATRRPATGKGAGRAAQQPGKDADTLALEKAVSDALGLAVDIRHKGAKGGEIRIAYRTLEQLDTICRQLRARLQ